METFQTILLCLWEPAGWCPGPITCVIIWLSHDKLSHCWWRRWSSDTSISFPASSRPRFRQWHCFIRDQFFTSTDTATKNCGLQHLSLDLSSAPPRLIYAGDIWHPTAARSHLLKYIMYMVISKTMCQTFGMITGSKMASCMCTEETQITVLACFSEVGSPVEVSTITNHRTSETLPTNLHNHTTPVWLWVLGDFSRHTWKAK